MIKFKKTLPAAALMACLGSMAFADNVVSDIKVDADFSALDSQMAANFWPNIEADLKAEIGERLAPMAGEDGLQVDVSIRELAINAAASDATYKDLNGIDGVVAIRGPEENDLPKSFRVAYSVVPPEGGVTVPGLIVLPPDSADNYAALIDAVADEVVKQVNDYKM